jgi:DNA-binding CsgD family transcriptional regulator
MGVPKQAQELLTATRQPAVWAVVFFTALSEASSFNALAVASPLPQTLEAMGTWPVLSMALYATMAALANRVGSLCARPWLAPMLGITGFLGLALRAAADSQTFPTILGDTALNASIALLGYEALESLVGMTLDHIVWAIAASSVLSALFVPFYSADSFWSVAIPLVACTATVQLAGRSCPLSRRRAVHVGGRVGFPWALAASFFILATSFGFLQLLLYRFDGQTVRAVSTFTKLLAFLIFIFVMYLAQDTGYPALLKVVCTFSVASLALFLLVGQDGVISFATMATGYSLLEITYTIVMINVASATSTSVLRVISLFYLVETFGYCCGGALSCGPVDVAGGYAGAVSWVLLVAVTVAAIWLVTDRRINALVWGDKESRSHASFPTRMADEVLSEMPPDTEIANHGCVGNTHEDGLVLGSDAAAKSERGVVNGPVRTYDEKVALLALRYNLSPKELEVIRMFAAGRSATYIAETKFVSSGTVRTHIKHVYAKCSVHSRQELITLIEGLGADA